MKIYKLPPLSVCQTNCYIVESQQKNAVLIDPADKADFILAELKRHEVLLKKILLTHGHCDHIGALAQVALETGCEVYIHSLDIDKLCNNRKNLSCFITDNSCKPYDKATAVNDGDIIKLDELEFEVIHTPGHTEGSVCYACGDFLFTGDTLFCGSAGRTDFPGGSYAQQEESMQKLAAIEKNFKIFSGHGEDTTLDFEKKTNMFLSQVDSL